MWACCGALVGMGVGCPAHAVMGVGSVAVTKMERLDGTTNCIGVTSLFPCTSYTIILLACSGWHTSYTIILLACSTASLVSVHQSCLGLTRLTLEGNSGSEVISLWSFPNTGHQHPVAPGFPPYCNSERSLKNCKNMYKKKLICKICIRKV